MPADRALHHRARLIVVDDHEDARAGIRTLLTGQRDIEIVGEAANGRVALELHRRLRPDLVLVDIHMPELDGLSVTRIVKQRSPATHVVVMTMDPNPVSLKEALRMGADAYVLKGTPTSGILTVLRQALSGGPLLQPEIASHLVETIRTSPKSLFASSLTAMEEAILQLSAEGQSIMEIARVLKLEPQVVRTHAGSILAKL